jgi:hypothetical protein
MLAAVSNLQGALGQKAGRSELEQALSRKLDIRTFLASHGSQPGMSDPAGNLLPSGGALLTPQHSTLSRQSALAARSDREPNLSVHSPWQGRQLPPTPGIMMRPVAVSTTGSTAGDVGAASSRVPASSAHSKGHGGMSLRTPQATPTPMVRKHAYLHMLDVHFSPHRMCCMLGVAMRRTHTIEHHW